MKKMMSIFMLLSLAALTSCSEDVGTIKDSSISVKVNNVEYKFKSIRVNKIEDGNNGWYTIMYKSSDTLQVIDNSKATITVTK